jgi:hypothetical protein
MITSQGLEQLGFTLEIDFVLQDNSDGPFMENGLREQNVFIAEWKSASPQPSEAEIEAAHNEWQAEYDSTEYQRLRAPEYPPIGDQLDMLWHAIDTGDWTAAKAKTTEFYTALKTVKDANPKP